MVSITCHTPSVCRSERADHLVNDPILHCLLSVKILVAIEVKLNLQAQITHEQG